MSPGFVGCHEMQRLDQRNRLLRGMFAKSLFPPSIQKDEIVFVVVPHVVRGADIRPEDLRPIDTGTGQSIDLRHVDNSASAGAPGAHPVAMDTPHSTFGTVPGQSADAAAPAASAQMRASMQPSFTAAAHAAGGFVSGGAGRATGRP